MQNWGSRGVPLVQGMIKELEEEVIFMLVVKVMEVAIYLLAPV